MASSSHYIPKSTTQQTEFLKKYPTYDGRDTIAAIVDTGVDLSCPGLQTTSTGLPKVVECCDLTGAGDVDTSTIKKADENEILIGLTERELKIPRSWKNPSGEWHLGTKAIYELYTPEIIKRIYDKRNEELLKKNNIAIAAVMKEQSNSHLNKETAEDLIAKLEYLQAAKDVAYESPVADCIVWNDGQKWKACIDLSFTGDLENAKIMSSYHENYEYGFISDKCLVSYCLNIYDEGNLLEICVPNGNHGTHVAHIAAGHFPDCPEKDGLAPGAQIVSLCVGDLRKGMYLTEQALLRALEKCRQLKVDVINYSYGASPNCVESGNIGKSITEIVKKYGIIFVAAAGNDGPNLSTMGFASGQLHHSVMYIGANLSADMKDKIYGQREPSTSVVYPFSSRGPCLDGTWGVCVSAPGAAVTGVPKHELKSSDLICGTSMSCPNAAGNILCLLSGMKSESVPISPFRIKFALMNSAHMPEDGSPYCLGAGIVQISSAFEFIKSEMASIPKEITDIRIDINGKRGVYLRNIWETSKAQIMETKVITDFSEDNESRVNYECLIQLDQSKGKIGLIKYPLKCRLPSSEWNIKVDPTKLEPGKVHVAEIIGLSSNNASLGPLFRLPITVIQPKEVGKKTNFCYKEKLTLKPAIPQRLFIKTPSGSKYAVITVRSLQSDSDIVCDVQCVCIDSKKILKQNQKNVCIPSKSLKDLYFHTSGNTTLELSITKEWSSCSASEIGIKVKFFGFSIENGSLSSTNPTSKISFTNNLRSVDIAPSIELSEFCYRLNPLTPIIEAMKERDMVFGSPSFRLLIKYNFVADELGYYKFEHEGIEFYRKHLDCYLLQVFSSTKKHILTCSWPEYVTLGKGCYIIRIQYRHTDTAILKKLQQASLLVTTSVQKIIPLLFTDSRSALCYDPENSLYPQEELFKSKTYLQNENNEFFMQRIFWFPRFYRSGSYYKGSVYLQSTSPSKDFSRFDITYSMTDAYYDQSGRESTASFQSSGSESSISLNVYYHQSFNLLFEAVDYAMKEKNIPLLAAYTDNFMDHQRITAIFTLLTNAFYNMINRSLDKYLADNIPGIFQNEFGSQKEGNVQSVQHSMYPKISTTNDTIEIMAKQLLSTMRFGDKHERKTSFDSVFSNNNQRIVVSPCPDDPLPLNPTPSCPNFVVNMPSTPVVEGLPFCFNRGMSLKDTKTIPVMIEKLFEAYMLIDSTSENARIIKAKYAVVHERYGTALSELKKIITDQKETSDYLSIEKAIIQILKKLGWHHLAEEAQKALLIKYQKFYRLF